MPRRKRPDLGLTARPLLRYHGDMEQGQYQWQSRPGTWPILGPTSSNLNPRDPNEINVREEYTEDDIEVGDTVELNTRGSESIRVRVDEIGGVGGERCRGTVMPSGPETEFHKEHVFSFLDEPKKKAR